MFHGTLSNAEAILLSGFLGFVGGILSSFGLNLLRRRQQRRSLRRALLQEIELPKAVIERAVEQDVASFNGPLHTDIPTTVYESNAADIGLLTPEETEAVIAYYGTAAVAKHQLKGLDDAATAERFFDTTAKILKRNRQEAVEKLRAEL